MKKIEIEIPDGKQAKWVNGVLTLVDEKPKDVTERIKTFEDACRELNEPHSAVHTHPLVLSYYAYKDAEHDIDWKDADILAYLKLRIICAALNEGWQPKFIKNEKRYYPWFCLYTKTKLEEMTEEDKKKLVIIDTGDYDTEYAGLVYAYSAYAPSLTIAYFGSRLCFKNSDLAEYCGKQFINLWADYLLRRK